MKRLSYILFAAVLGLGMHACKDKGDVVADTATENTIEGGVDKVLDADDAKEYMEDAVSDFLNYFNTKDQKEAIELADGLVYKFEEYDWESIYDYFDDQIDRRLVSRLLGEAVSTRKAPSRSYVDWDASVFYGVFEANDRAEEWRLVEKGEAGRLELRFKSLDKVDCVAVAQASGETYVWEGDGDMDELENWRIHVPQTVTFSLKKGSTEIISSTSNVDAKMNDHVNVSSSLQIANLRYATNAHITMQSGDYDQSLSIGGHTILYTKVNLPKYQLIEKRNRDTWEDYIDEYYDDWEDLMDEVGDVIAEVNLLSRVQIKVKVTDANDLYADLKSIGNRDMDAERRVKKYAETLNDYTFAGVYYGSDKLQARILADYKSEEEQHYSYYSGYYYTTKYYVTPILQFVEDRSEYDLTEYFTERRFRSAYNDLADLIDDYLDLLEYNRLDNPLD